MNNTSIEIFTRLLVEKHEELRRNMNHFFRTVTLEDKNQKVLAVQTLLKSSVSLIDLLSSKDRPQWLNTVKSSCDNFMRSKDSFKLLNSLTLLKNKVDNHDWWTDNPTALGCDFDAIFKKYKDESRLNELFDSITSILEQMVTDGHIDSIRILDQLKKIIATIKKNKNGSYFSMMGTWNFFVHFMKNVLWDELTKIPLLGSLLKTLAEVTDEVDKELELVHKQVGEEVEKEFNTPLQSITYSSTAKLLPTTSITFEATA